MVTKTMYQKIQKCKRKGWLKSRISKELGLDPATVAKYYNMGEGEYREYVNGLMYRGKIFDRYKEEIIEVYKRNDYKRLLGLAVYDYLEERAYVRVYSNVSELRHVKNIVFLNKGFY